MRISSFTRGPSRLGGVGMGGLGMVSSCQRDDTSLRQPLRAPESLLAYNLIMCVRKPARSSIVVLFDLYSSRGRSVICLRDVAKRYPCNFSTFCFSGRKTSPATIRHWSSPSPSRPSSTGRVSTDTCIFNTTALRLTVKGRTVPGFVAAMMRIRVRAFSTCSAPTVMMKSFFLRPAF